MSFPRFPYPVYRESERAGIADFSDFVAVFYMVRPARNYII